MQTTVEPECTREKTKSDAKRALVAAECATPTWRGALGVGGRETGARVRGYLARRGAVARDDARGKAGDAGAHGATTTCSADGLA